eukprot:gene37890-49656_t
MNRNFFDDIDMHAATHPHTTNTSYRKWITDNLQQQQAVLYAAISNQHQKDLYHIQTYPADRTTFPINSYVLQQYEGDKRPPHKLSTELRGPHRVVAHNPETDVYTVQNLVTNKLEDFSVHDLQPFYYDPQIVDPEQIARKDIQATEIEKITAHREDRTDKTRMKFRVKWINELEQIWEPWTNLRDTKALHQYLAQNKMKALIP